MPAAMSATEMPTLAGASSVPVIEISPTSLCTSRSYAFFCEYGPDDAVPRHVADDEARMPVAQDRRGRAQPIGRARRQVLHEDVGAREQPREDAGRFRPLQVQRQRLLRPVQPDEVAREPLDGRVVAAREVAAVGPLDLDHARAEVGELPRRERRGDGLLEGDDGDAFQWEHRCSLA